VNATAQSNKGGTFQRLECAVDTGRAVTSVGSAARVHDTAAEHTEVFVFHRVHTIRTGGAATAVHTHFKATVRTTRRRRRYLSASRQTLTEVRFTAAVYNEARKAGASIEQAHRVVRAVHSLDTPGGRLDSAGSDEETAPITSPAGPAIPVPTRAHRSTWRAAVARAVAAVTPHRKNRTQGKPVLHGVLPAPHIHPTRTPDLFTHHTQFGWSGAHQAHDEVTDFIPAVLRSATSTTTIRTPGSNTAGGVRVHELAPPPVAQETPPQERSRPHPSMED
jgi:hypothetical protein